MTAADLIHRAIEAGVELAVGQDGRLQLRADRPPPADLVAELAAHKVEIVATLSAANDPQPSHAWLHLLVLADGRVIQHCGEQSTIRIEQDARLQYGDYLLALVGVPGLERPVTESEIVKALAGTLAAPEPALPPSSIWLARVARLLGTRPAELLEGGHLEQCDLIEQAGIDASVIADHIRSSSAWIERKQRIELPVERIIEGEEGKPQRIIETAATAPSEWHDARNRYHNHVFPCPACHAPTGRYCQTGAQLLALYSAISWS
ncbi:hypothetical protein [Stutzerimonas nitrititolerans]|uniref:hypothetical protein n=1 Tax=Stutzerimonas nitrititolerans TaxID=2482751 RepID=UPI00289A5D7F|nr:hypothetical protein [Stutzerimonas nitrititolerans]